jgi:DNA polymerase III epsilon subunit-like protein
VAEEQEDVIAAIFDTETTGLPLHPRAKLNKQPRIIEFAVLLINERGEELGELEFTCNPEQPLEAIITKITGLTDDDLKDEPLFSAHLAAVKEIMARADVLVAHNLPFDHFLLSSELARCSCQDLQWPAHNLCTAQTYHEAWGKRPRLLELYEHVTGEPLAQTHRAMDDVRALARIVTEEHLLELYNDSAIEAAQRVFIQESLRADSPASREAC